ncbi:MAG: hypothetical protein NUV91_07600 [Candidatus Omnitrophica bacterium]|nr:hypothetical protein [Candidatus Omnitrophota bacterium]
MDCQKSIPNAKHPQKNSSLPFLTPENTIAMYTILAILVRMKKQLGIEAMMEYMNSYLGTIEEYNPRLKEAIQEALSLINIEKMYCDAIPGKKDKTG